jgi:hypothetical protein
MGSYAIPKEIFKGMTKSQKNRWDDLESKMAEGDMDLIIRKTSAGFPILELFNNKGEKLHEDRLDRKIPGPGYLYSKNLVSSLTKYFKETVFKEL